MAWTKYQIFVVLVMLTSASINVLVMKWADNTTAADCKGRVYSFDHPFFQASTMFFGEFLCLVVFKAVYYISRWRGTESVLTKGNLQFNPLIFLPPAMLDMCATSSMYIALNLTYASSYQMLRGSLVIFVGLLSVAFLGRVLKAFHWLGMVTVVAGVAVVGVSDMLLDVEENSDINGVISGDLLILAAQIMYASQSVYEERFLTKHNIPALQAVGWEGLFGFCVLGVLLIPMNYINAGQFSKNDPEHLLENVPSALCQIGNSWILLLAIIVGIVTTTLANYGGMSVTKELTATTRTVIDNARTLVIWAVALAVQWQKFYYLQVVGFVVLYLGICIYNDVFFRPLLMRARSKGENSTATSALDNEHNPSINQTNIAEYY